MAVDTAKVVARRELHFQSIQDILDDAEAVQAAPKIETLGNWSAGQIFKHLANTFDMSIDGAEVQAPLWMRIMARMMKKRAITKPMSPGFKLPQNMAQQVVAPESTTTEEAVAALRTAVARLQGESKREPHPAFGSLTREEWDQLHLRHSEMHLSFLVPGE